jgi:glycosyltransferase involved in cell wall biosynthesis
MRTALRKSPLVAAPTPASPSPANPAVGRGLRVRAVGRFDAFSAPGGGEVQLRSTVTALAEAGHDARAWHPWDDDLGAGDLVHFFGSRPEFLPAAAAAKNRGARVVVSTVAWFDWRNTLREPGPWPKKLVHAARYATRAALPQWASWRKRLYDTADLLLPNSQAEAAQLMRLFRVPATTIRVVPNGADRRFASADPKLFRARYGLDRFVLCVGRIEPRKNQLALVRALAGTGLPLVFIGEAVPGHERYAARCRREADANAHFLGRLSPDDPLLASAYAACSTMALVSWYETPGLVALEAAMTGTPLVLPEGGCAREYFGDSAEYVAPHDLPAIRRAVLRSSALPRRPEMAALVHDNFTWSKVARATAEAYESLR